MSEGTQNTLRRSNWVREYPVFIGSSDGAVYALEASTGKQAWRFQTGEELPAGQQTVIAPPRSDAAQMAGAALEDLAERAARGERHVTATALVDGNTVYIGSWDRRFYALDAATGKKAWSFETLPEAPLEMRWSSAPPVVRDAVAYVANFVHSPPRPGTERIAAILVHAIDPQSGASLWSSRIEGRSTPSPLLLTEKYLVLASTPPGTTDRVTLHAIERASGREKWRFDAHGAKHHWKNMYDVNRLRPPVALGDELVMVGTDNGISALDLETGTERWRLSEPFQKEPIKSIMLSGVLFVNTGDVFASMASGHLYGVDPSTGQVRWSRKAASGDQMRAAIDGIVYMETVVLVRRSLVAFDGADGRRLGAVWSRGLLRGGSYGICSGPALYGDRLLISTERQMFMGQAYSPGYLYSVATPQRKAR